MRGAGSGRPAATSKGVASRILTRSPNTSASPRLAMPSTPHPLQCLDAIAAIRPCHRRQEICRQGQAANTWYCMLSGAALRCVIKSDGRRQIVDLLFPGDFFGLAAGAEYDYTVEAATPGTVVAGYPRKQVEIQADSDPWLARELRQITFDGLSRLQEQLMIFSDASPPSRRWLPSSLPWPTVCQTAVATASRYRSRGMTLRTIWLSRLKL